MIPARFPQFEASSIKVLKALDVSLERISGLTCCPEPLSMKTLNREMWYSVAARNISLAESMGLDIMTVCNGCTETLFEANRDLKEDDKLRLRVNRNLREINMSFKGTIQVKSMLRVLCQDIGTREIRNHVKLPLSRTRVAVHYGCHIFPELSEFDDPMRPHSLQTIIHCIGGETVSYANEMTCCAAFARPINEDASLEFVKAKFEGLCDVRADCLVVICPYCFLQMDLGQMMLNRKSKSNFQIPVIYLSQLIGLTFGFNARDLGFDYHFVKVESFAKKIAVGNGKF
jgi:heterodisulfide reductase subunit B